jgi:uncharacterized protein (TIGR02145 family)
MKFLLWGLFAFVTLAHAQGTVTDIDGNTYDYLTYGTQQWTVENAAMETYRDGTPIPQVTDATQWSNLTTGAWCYYDNDPTKGKLYNWYAVAGIHDNDPNTPNKEFAPEGWHVPTDAEWTTLEEHLIANGYNYDGTTTGNKIGKSMASISGWISSPTEGSPGNDQSLNNSSDFNVYPYGVLDIFRSEKYVNEGMDAFIWSSTEYDTNQVWTSNVPNNYSYRGIEYLNKKFGCSVRFVQNSNTCSEASINASATEVCTGESVDLTVSSGLTAGTTACTSADLPANLQTGLVGYWPFCGNANDESGNGLDGDIYLNPILTTGYDGTEDSAYDFDWDNVTGYGTAWQRIEVPYTNQLNNSDITITAWIKPETFYWPNNSIQNSMIIGSSQACTSTNLRFSLNSDGSLNFSLNSGLGITSGPNKILLNTWQHVAVRANSNEMELFINGISQGVVSHSTNPDFDGCLVIGEHHQGNGHWYYFDGIIDNIGIWNRAISPSEIQQLVNPPTYLWSTGDTTENITVIPTETTEYWVDVTTNGVTCREYITIDVTSPAAPTGDSEQTFCEALTFADLTATGDNIQWYDAATGGNLLNSTTALTDGQMVYASQTVNGCESTDRLEVTVSVQDITITASASEVCAGESVDLTVSSGLTAGSTACTSADLPANLQTGLVGYWPFCGNANDESGNGNNGTVNGATLTTDRFGNADSAYSFDGVNDYISLNDTFFNGSSVTELTHSLWFNVTNYPANGSYSFSTKEGYWRTISFALTTNNQIRFGGSQPSPQQYFNIYSPQNIVPMNSWNNITVTYQNSTLKLYLNGSLVSTETIALSSLNYSYLAAGNSTSTNLIGASHPVSPGLKNFVDGKIDDFTLWNRALTEAEVQQLAGAPSYTWSTGNTTETISVTPTETTEYWVDVTTNGVTCREYITIDVTSPAAPNCDTAGIDDLGITSFSIYPNPTTDYINIDCSSLESVFVYNILGKELIKETSNRIDVSTLSKGIYFIKVSDGINSSTKKFIKN